jgi:hypothetical protein
MNLGKRYGWGVVDSKDIKRRGYSARFRGIASLVLLVFTVGSLPVQEVWAQASVGDPLSVNTSNYVAPQSCGDICENRKKVYEAAGWTERSGSYFDGDEATTAPKCQALCEPIRGLDADPSYCTALAPAPEGSKVSQTLLDVSGMTAEKASNYLLACKYKNLQLDNRCTVYEKTKDVDAWQIALLSVEAVAAGICAYACFADNAQPGWGQACSIGACAAGGLELINSLFVAGNEGVSQSQNSGLAAQRVLGGIAGAAAITLPALMSGQGFCGSDAGGAGWGASSGRAPASQGAAHAQLELPGMKLKDAYKIAGRSTYGLGKKDITALNDPVVWVALLMGPAFKLQMVASMLPEAGATGGSTTDGSTTDGSTTGEGSGDTAAEQRKKASCVAMGILVALAAIRAWSMIDTAAVRKDSCKAVEELMSSSVSLGDSGSRGGPSYNNYSPMTGSLGGGGGGSSTTTNGSMGSSGSDYDGDGIPNTVDSDPYGVQQMAEAAGMSPILKGSPDLGRLAVERGMGLDRSAFRKSLETQGAASALSGLAASMGAPPQAQNAIAGIAQLASDAAKDLAPLVGAGMYSGGGGAKSAGGGGGSKNDAGGFAGLFGAKPAGPLGGGMDFGARGPAGVAESTDVFHTGTSKSLFQIVSERVRAVEPRLK